jgi:hypothetical protein
MHDSLQQLTEGLHIGLLRSSVNKRIDLHRMAEVIYNGQYLEDITFLEKRQILSKDLTVLEGRLNDGEQQTQRVRAGSTYNRTWQSVSVSPIKVHNEFPHLQDSYP